MIQLTVTKERLQLLIVGLSCYTSDYEYPGTPNPDIVAARILRAELQQVLDSYK